MRVLLGSWLLARAVALVLAIAIFLLLGSLSEAQKTYAIALAAVLIAGVILSVILGIRRRIALNKL